MVLCKLPPHQSQGSSSGGVPRWEAMPYVIDTGTEMTLARKVVVSVQHLPKAQRQICGVTGHCMRMKGPVVTLVGVRGGGGGAHAGVHGRLE